MITSSRKQVDLVKGAKFEMRTKKSKRHFEIRILVYYGYANIECHKGCICHLYHVGGCSKLVSCHYDEFMNNNQKY